MQYLKEKFTVDVGRVNPEMCCEGCVFGGKHEEWCPIFVEYLEGQRCPCDLCQPSD